MNKKHFGNVLLITVISFFSLIAASSDLEFKFQHVNRKIIYSYGTKTDTVTLVDENNKKHDLKSGSITAVSVSTDDPNAHDMNQPIKVGSQKTIEMRSLYKCDLPLAIIDGEFYAFDANGGVFPLPLLNPKDWESDFATKEDRVEQTSLKVIAKTDTVQGEQYAITELIYITTPQLLSTVIHFKSSLRRPFNLQDLGIGVVKVNKGPAFVLFEPRTKLPIIDANDKNVSPAVLEDMEPLSSDLVYAPKLQTPTTAIVKSEGSESGKPLPTQEVSDEQAQAELKRIHKWLEDNIIGQPEVVDRLYKMALKRYIYGHTYSTKPEQATLMGPPGTGKDTSVHAYVDAINNEEGAWENNNHMFEMPVVKSDANLWTLQGSSTGHIGSEIMPPFISFLVKHSGGKYKEVIERDPRSNKISSTYVELNKDWKEGQVLEGYFPPSKGVVFVNESQHWSKKAKDQFLKKALEGSVTINNPGKGENVISVPVTWFLATNEGEGLVIPQNPTANRQPQNHSVSIKPLEIGKRPMPMKLALMKI